MVRPLITLRRHTGLFGCGWGSVTANPGLPAWAARRPADQATCHMPRPTPASPHLGAALLRGPTPPRPRPTVLAALTWTPAPCHGLLAFSTSPGNFTLRLRSCLAHPAGEGHLSAGPSCPCASGQHPLWLWASARRHTSRSVAWAPGLAFRGLGTRADVGKGAPLRLQWGGGGAYECRGLLPPKEPTTPPALHLPGRPPAVLPRPSRFRGPGGEPRKGPEARGGESANGRISGEGRLQRREGQRHHTAGSGRTREGGVKVTRASGENVITGGPAFSGLWWGLAC